MKRNIAIVAGGDTSEIVVSLRSAQGTQSLQGTLLYGRSMPLHSL